jgi:hypothetical protein
MNFRSGTRYLMRDETKNFQDPALSYIKRRGFLRRFQKYKFTLVTKCTYQKIFQVLKKHGNLRFLRFFTVKTWKNL